MNIRGFVVVLALLLAIPLVHATALGISPSVITIENAVKGQEYKESLWVSAMSDTNVNAMLNASGNVSGFIHFYYLTDTKNEINNVDVPADGQAQLMVVIRIPADTPNGEYDGKISTVLASKNDNTQTNSAVTMMTSSLVMVKVTGTQTLTGDVRSITANDVESGQPLRIMVEFENTGNVKAQPKIDIQISKNGQAVDKITQQNESVDIGGFKIIEVEWDTEGRGIGNMTANVKVYLDNKLLTSQDVQFKILKSGSVTAQGLIGQVIDPKNPSLQNPSKMEVEFYNKGLIDVKAKIIGEVYVDGKLTDTIDGQEVLVKVSDKQTLSAYFTPKSYGKYVINRSVIFEGQKIDLKPLSFTLQKGKTTSVSTSSRKSTQPSVVASSEEPSVLFIVIVLVFLLLIAGAMVVIGIFIARKIGTKKKHPNKDSNKKRRRR